jgi:hypothetical protein
MDYSMADTDDVGLLREPLLPKHQSMRRSSMVYQRSVSNDVRKLLDLDEIEEHELLKKYIYGIVRIFKERDH